MLHSANPQIQLAGAAAQFETRLEECRRRVAPDLEWYRYHSLANIAHIEELLAGSGYTLPGLLAEGPVLDIGCADGELAFFLETLGVTVTAVDHPKSNQNGMRGVRLLKQALGSCVEIRQVDIDEHFDLGSDRWGLACLLGVLYHLKNPFCVLERLSRYARYCLLSTRIAKYLPGHQVRIAESPLAYLVDDYELNGDPTNFWIFSEMGLRRLISRAQWSIRAWQSFGETTMSDPNTLDNDERAFCLLESRYGVMETVDLAAGWYGAEEAGWRWTARCFEARAYGELRGAISAVMDLYIPELAIERFGSLTLRCWVNGSEAPPETYVRAGRYRWERLVRVAQPPVVLRFEVDKAIPPDTDLRERGIIVADLRVFAA